MALQAKVTFCHAGRRWRRYFQTPPVSPFPLICIETDIVTAAKHMVAEINRSRYKKAANGSQNETGLESSRSRSTASPREKNGNSGVRQDQNSLDLFMVHRTELVDYASGIVGSRSQGEDVVQEAWLRFASAAARRLLDEPVSYLYRVVRNVALDRRRRQKSERQYLVPQIDKTAQEATDGLPSPEAYALHREQLAIVREALCELPERTRIAIEMHRLEGRKLKDIAAHLGISIALTHGLIAEGVAHCRRHLKRRS